MYLTHIDKNVKHARNVLDILCMPPYLITTGLAMGWRKHKD